MEYTYDAERFRRVFEPNFTWIAGFQRNVRRYDSHTALIDPIAEKSWTYAELNAVCVRYANALKKAGVGAGNVVLYQLMNSPQFVFTYIAPQMLGAVNAPANFNLSPGETARLLAHNRPAVYIYDCEVASMAEAALKLSSWQPPVVLAVDYHGKHPNLPAGHRHLADFITEDGADDLLPPPPVDLYSEATRLFTSGTTGLPKGVPVNNVNEVLSAHDVIMHFPLTSSDVTMNTTPWFHRGGLHSGGLTPTLYVGGTVVVMRMFSARACLELAEKYGVTFILGVPTVLEKLAERQKKFPRDLSRLHGIVTMGSALERDACIRYQQLLTPNIFNGYGTTESFWNSFLRPDDLPEMAGSAGRACTDDEIRVVRLYDDHPAEPDDTVPQDGETVGEIIIFSPYKSSQSYYDNSTLTDEKFRGGWLYTHDLGTWDSEHYIRLSGRRDDMIICMGENIYPEQVEEAICRHPGVQDCLVTGVDDPVRGQVVAAYILPTGPDLTVQSVSRFCADSVDLSAYMCPRFYQIVDRLPYNATGKKMHAAARKQGAEDMKNGLWKRP